MKHPLSNSPPPDFQSLGLPAKRRWVAQQILASHRFPFGDGPGTAFNGAFHADTWRRVDDAGDSVILKLQGGPLAFHRYIHFCVVFNEGTCEPSRLFCNRETLLSSIGAVTVRKSVGDNPYWPGHAFDVWCPGRREPARATWSFALRALHDLAQAGDATNKELQKAVGTISAFGEKHGHELDQDFMGMPLAMRTPAEMLEGGGRDTSFGRALATCLAHAEPNLKGQWDWVEPVVATFWCAHGPRVEARYRVSPEIDHDVLDERMRPGMPLR